MKALLIGALCLAGFLAISTAIVVAAPYIAGIAIISVIIWLITKFGD